MHRKEEQDKAEGTGEGQIQTVTKKLGLYSRPKETIQELSQSEIKSNLNLKVTGWVTAEHVGKQENHLRS